MVPRKRTDMVNILLVAFITAELEKFDLFSPMAVFNFMFSQERVFLRVSQQSKGTEMCRYQQPWEGDSSQDDGRPHTRSGAARGDARWEAPIAMLEMRIANIETRVERLEAKMLRMQRGMGVVCGLFFVTLIYAMYK